MAPHNINEVFHRLVVALNHLHLPPKEEAMKLKELNTRFGPTFHWLPTWTESIPLPTLSPTVASPSIISSAATSATQIGSSGSGINVGGIVGGIVGGLLVVAALIFVIRFLFNRRRKRNIGDNVAEFNATAFRRSAILIEGPPTYDETVESGFNSRPPTMVEPSSASPASTFNTQCSSGLTVLPPPPKSRSRKYRV
ncbi:hypothetical protein C0995_009297 [Termitomyces sp. Mi166|nr:hypothetical protein C0995_009297 [Termitomyces sp. Mi166\